MEPRTSPEIGGMGHSVKRKEDLRFLRGKGNYVDDIKLPDMIYLDIVRSPLAHAKIKNIDVFKSDWRFREFLQLSPARPWKSTNFTGCPH